MKKIEYQTPVIKTLTMECLMQDASGNNGVSGTVDGTPSIGEGGIDEGGTMDPDAKVFGNRSVWDD